MKYNQFQNVYSIKNKKILVDFLHNNIKFFDNNTEFDYKYDTSYEKLALQLEEKLAKKINNTLYITFITSLDCNMHCVYCYEKGIENKSVSNTNSIKITNLVDFVRKEFNRKKYNNINVVILGGEPLLEKYIDLVDEFIYQIKKITNKTHFSIVSNGMNIKQYLNKLIQWEIDDMQITLDGTEIVHNNRRYALDKKINSFSEIVEGIDLLCEYNVPIFLRTNIDRNNIDDLINFADFIIKKQWISKGVKPYIYPVTCSGSKKYKVIDSEIELFKKVIEKFRQFPRLEKIFELDFHGIQYIRALVNNIIPQIKTKFCGVSNGQYVLSNNGDIFNCWWGLEEDDFKIGKITDTEYHLDKKKVQQFEDRTVLKLFKCKSCRFKFMCGGGCSYKELSNEKTVTKGHCYPYDLLIEEYLKYAFAE